MVVWSLVGVILLLVHWCLNILYFILIFCSLLKSKNKTKKTKARNKNEKHKKTKENKINKTETKRKNILFILFDNITKANHILRCDGLKLLLDRGCYEMHITLVLLDGGYVSACHMCFLTEAIYIRVLDNGWYVLCTSRFLYMYDMLYCTLWSKYVVGIFCTWLFYACIDCAQLMLKLHVVGVCTSWPVRTVLIIIFRNKDTYTWKRFWL